MPETSPCVLGVESCGCITYANSAPDRLDRDDEKALAKRIRNGGQILRTTVGEARAMPDFLPSECPHDPKGWERTVDKPFEPSARCRRVSSRGVWRVDIKTHGWESGGFPAGEVREWSCKWWATEGWFNYRAAGANDGGSPPREAPEHGPFGTKKEAVAHLLPLGVERAKQLQAEWAEQRRQKAAA